MPDLKPPLKGYALWFMVDDESHKTLQQLVDDLARSFDLRPFEFHATLIGLLDHKPDQLPLIREMTSRLARMERPFNLEIVGIGQRDQHFQSVFLPVVSNREALNLNTGARIKFQKPDEANPFFPHFSAAYGDLEPVTKAAIRTVMHDRLTFPMSVNITSLAIVDVHGYPDEWKIVDRIPLSAT
jgi:2'-5' RNA ligase